MRRSNMLVHQNTVILRWHQNAVILKWLQSHQFKSETHNNSIEFTTEHEKTKESFNDGNGGVTTQNNNTWEN